jgi:hypothetical protein
MRHHEKKGEYDRELNEAQSGTYNRYVSFNTTTGAINAVVGTTPVSKGVAYESYVIN